MRRVGDRKQSLGRYFAAASTCVIAVLIGSQGAFSQSGPTSVDEALVGLELANRERMVREEPEQLAAQAPVIQQALVDVDALLKQANYTAAWTRLAAVNPNLPLEDVPSLDVQLMAMAIAAKSGDQALAQKHSARAVAILEVLRHRIGSGSSTDDPVRIDSIDEIRSWQRGQEGNISDLHTVATKAGEFYSVQFVSTAASAPPALVYFQLAAPVRAAFNILIDPLAPVPLDRMTSAMRAGYDRAQQARERFLSDTSFNYLRLIKAMNDAVKEASALLAAGNSKGAVERINQIAAVRPVVDVPVISFLTLYSAALGASEQRDQQRQMRDYLFGLIQSLAHGGDARSFATAVEVVSLNDEYYWINTKHMKLKLQSVVEHESRSYDVMTCTDAGGGEHVYYFDITRLSARENAALNQR